MRNRSYHFQNNSSLIFQFIVSEYLNICHAFESYEKATQQNHYDAAKSALETLIGNREDHFHTFSSHSSAGLLTLLQNSCQSFSFNDDTDLISTQKLCNHVQKAHRTCHQILAIIENMDTDQAKTLFLHTATFNLKVEECLTKIGRHIEKLFLQFEDDETILYFMLAHHREMDDVYSAPIVKKMFKKMFPKGIDGAEKYLKAQYSRRGYHHLVPQIEMAASELK